MKISSLSKGSYGAIEVKGLDELIQAFYSVGAESEVQQSFQQSLYEEANVVFARSQMLVPVDTGALRSSGQVSQPKMDGKTAYVEISYGGPSASYALYVHESFDNHKEPTQRKYLEQPLNERAPFVARNIGMRLSDILRRKLNG